MRFAQSASGGRNLNPSSPSRSSARLGSAPDFVPTGVSAIRPAALPRGEFGDESARFIGAVRPGDTTARCWGWSAFAEN